MKTFPLKLSDDLHKEIKLKALEAGKSMHQYILDCVKYPPVIGAFDVKIVEGEEEGCKHDNGFDAGKCALDNGFVARSDKIYEKPEKKTNPIGITKEQSCR